MRDGGRMIFGVTGGIGSGKSTVTRYLVEKCGFFSIDADGLTREAHGDATVCEALAAAFGEEVAPADGRGVRRVDRGALGRAAFRSSEGAQCLNRIMRPALEARLIDSLERWKSSGKAHCLIDAALLYEADWHRRADRVAAVVAPLETRLKRVEARDGLSREEILRRTSFQMDVGEMCRRADDVFYNVADLSALERQIANWRARLKL